MAHVQRPLASAAAAALDSTKPRVAAQCTAWQHAQHAQRSVRSAPSTVVSTRIFSSASPLGFSANSTMLRGFKQKGAV